MAGPAELMREIHRLRKFARDLQEQLDRIPRQLKARQSVVDRAEATLKEAQDAIKHLKVTAHEKDVALKSSHTKLKKRDKQLEEAAAAGAPTKELEGLRKEVANERTAIGQLEEEILGAIAESEEKTGDLPTLEAVLKKAREEYAAFEKTVGERRDGLTAQLTEAQQQLRSQEEQVPETIRVQYNRIVAAMGPDGFAAVQGRTCAACYTEITAQNYHDLARGAYFLCKSCGRILYPPQASES
jgi:predicted  nucleic acid-binding Zn-ribbon protein